MQVRGFSGASLKQGRVRNAAAASLAVRAWLQWRHKKKGSAASSHVRLHYVGYIYIYIYKPILN